MTSSEDGTSVVFCKSVTRLSVSFAEFCRSWIPTIYERQLCIRWDTQYREFISLPFSFQGGADGSNRAGRIASNQNFEIRINDISLLFKGTFLYTEFSCFLLLQCNENGYLRNVEHLQCRTVKRYIRIEAISIYTVFISFGKQTTNHTK